MGLQIPQGARLWPKDRVEQSEAIALPWQEVASNHAALQNAIVCKSCYAGSTSALHQRPESGCRVQSPAAEAGCRLEIHASIGMTVHDRDRCLSNTPNSRGTGTAAASTGSCAECTIMVQSPVWVAARGGLQTCLNPLSAPKILRSQNQAQWGILSPRTVSRAVSRDVTRALRP